jgi:hypothetical protein
VTCAHVQDESKVVPKSRPRGRWSQSTVAPQARGKVRKGRFVAGREIVLGLTPVQASLMIISLLVTSITEADGSTSALEGMVQLVLFGAFVVMVFA